MSQGPWQPSYHSFTMQPGELDSDPRKSTRKTKPQMDSEGFVTVRPSFRPPLVGPKTSTVGPKTSGNHFEALQESSGVEDDDDDDEKKVNKSAKSGTPAEQPDNPVALRGCKQDPVRAAPEPSTPLLALRGCRRSAVRFATAAAGAKDGISADATTTVGDSEGAQSGNSEQTHGAKMGCAAWYAQFAKQKRIDNEHMKI